MTGETTMTRDKDDRTKIEACSSTAIVGSLTLHDAINLLHGFNRANEGEGDPDFERICRQGELRPETEHKVLVRLYGLSVFLTVQGESDGQGLKVSFKSEEKKLLAGFVFMVAATLDPTRDVLLYLKGFDGRVWSGWSNFKASEGANMLLVL